MNNTEPERKVMNEAEARELFEKLSAIPQTSGHMRTTLTSDFTREYIQIFTSKELVEMDWLYLSGQMDRTQAEQYISLCGDSEKILERIHQLAKKIASHFTKKIPELLTNDGRGERKKGLRNLFQVVEQLSGFTPKELAGNVCNYSFFASTFKHTLFSLLGVKIIEIIQTTKDEKLRKLAIDFMSLAEEVSMRQENQEFIGGQLHNEINCYKRTFLDPANSRTLDTVIGYKPMSAEEKELQELEMESDMDEVRKEASYKKILFHKFRQSNPQMMSFGDDLAEKGRYAAFCAFRINFIPTFDIGLPQITKDHFGNIVNDFRIINGVVNMTLNPLTGNLQLITNKGINFSEILDQDRYCALKAYLIKELKKYLSGKEPDIDDLFARAPEENIREVQQQVCEEVKETREDNEDVTQEQIEPTWHYEPFKKPFHERVESEPQAEEETDTFKTLPKQKRKEVIDRIWGAKGPEVMAALKRLMKHAVRQEGSHVFFHSERTNQTLPVPNSDKIPPPLIMANLKNWGYSLMEYAEELGAKIS